jgi:hypothetical protein
MIQQKSLDYKAYNSLRQSYDSLRIEYDKKLTLIEEEKKDLWKSMFPSAEALAAKESLKKPVKPQYPQPYNGFEPV